MRIFHGTARLPFSKGTVAAIGIFDGVHRGHQRILRRAQVLAGRLGLPAIVLTFDPHPLAVLEPHHAPALLMPLRHRLRIFERLGMDAAVVLPFTRPLSNLLPEIFVERILMRKLRVREVLVGENFTFGRHQLGDVALLQELGRARGFHVTVIGPVRAGGVLISSTHVRRLIAEGELAGAERLLGRPVSILGEVVGGEKLGRKLGFPTANLEVVEACLPPRGVYAVRVRENHEVWAGMMNIGFKPTVIPEESPRRHTLEVHLFDFAGSLYGKDLEVEFIGRIRNERRFPSVGALARALGRDSEAARRILAKRGLYTHRGV